MPFVLILSFVFFELRVVVVQPFQFLLASNYLRSQSDKFSLFICCRFEKCGITVLRKDKQHHEEIHCEHREIQCTKDCQLLIPIQEFEGHNCLEALKSKVAGMIWPWYSVHTLQQKCNNAVKTAFSTLTGC